MPKAPRKSPIDRFTNASSSAISSGFSAALAFGTQPVLKNADATPASNTNRGPILTQYDPNNNNGKAVVGEDEEEDEEEDGDGQSPVEASKSKGKKTQKTSSVNASTRKEQNRLAQRDFRQRKQQYLRALEARVELLSASHDEQVDRLRYALRALLNENNHLRSLVSTLAGFIGNDNLGGTCQRAGLDRALLDDMLGSSAEKRMTEVWANWPGAKECQALKDLRKETQIPLEGYSETGDSYAQPNDKGAARKRKKGNEDEGEREKGKNKEKAKGKDKGKGKDEEENNSDGEAEDQAMEDSTQSNGNGNTAQSFINQRRSSLRSQNPVTNQAQFQNPPVASSTASTSVPSSASMNASSLSFLEDFNSSNPFNFNAATTPAPSYQDSMNNLVGQSSSGSNGIQNSNNNGFSLYGSSNESQALLAGLFGDGVSSTPVGNAGGNAGNNGNNHGFFGFQDMNFLNNPSNNNSNSSNQVSKTMPNSNGNNRIPPNNIPPPSSSNPIPLSTIMSQKPPSNHNVMSNPLGKEIIKRVIKLFQVMNHLHAEGGVQPLWPVETVVAYLSGGDISVTVDISNGKVESQMKSKSRRRSSSKKAGAGAGDDEDKEEDEDDEDGESFSIVPKTSKDQKILENLVQEFKKNRLLDLDGSISKGPFRDAETLDRLGQAMSQMTYYMSQYRINSSFVLPRILKPSELQQTRPHDPLVDGLPMAGLRDGLIEHEDKFDSDLVHLHLIDQILVHEGDVMSGHNWEVFAPFYYRYPWLADPSSLEICNGWRISRGEEPLTADSLWAAHERLYPNLEKRF